jgi:hypothetical protein
MYSHISLCVVVVGLVREEKRVEPLEQGVIEAKPQ